MCYFSYLLGTASAVYQYRLQTKMGGDISPLGVQRTTPPCTHQRAAWHFFRGKRSIARDTVP